MSHRLKKPVHTRPYHFLGIVQEMGSLKSFDYSKDSSTSVSKTPNYCFQNKITEKQ